MAFLHTATEITLCVVREKSYKKFEHGNFHITYFLVNLTKCRLIVKKAVLINNSNETHNTITQYACALLNVNSMHAFIFFCNQSRNCHIISKFDVFLPTLYVTKI